MKTLMTILILVLALAVVMLRMESAKRREWSLLGAEANRLDMNEKHLAAARLRVQMREKMLESQILPGATAAAERNLRDAEAQLAREIEKRDEVLRMEMQVETLRAVNQ